MYISFKAGDTLHIICKNEFPLTGWTQGQIEEALAFTKESGCTTLRIEGDDELSPFGDDRTLQEAGFAHTSNVPTGRKVWEKAV